MSRTERNSMWYKFKDKIKKIWIMFYLRVISPCLAAIGNGVEKIDYWFDKKIDNHRAKRQYLKALYDVDPIARLHYDIKQMKILLIVVMICVLALEIAVIF